MAYAFRTLRPLFRERGKINAEVTGRLTEALGGIRVVKSYTAEKREEIVFTKGAHRLFRNIAKSMTGVSATTAGSTVIVGIIGVLMIWLGGRAIIAGEMTLGDLIMYIFFIGLVAAPLVSIASIGTQITEAFAGLDRIREILDMPTEVDEDATRAPVDSARRATSAFEDVWFEYNRGSAGAARRVVSRRARDDDRAGRIERLRQEHADQPRHGVQPSDARARARRRARSRGPAARWTIAEQLASVLQENFLFDGTIAENVGYAQAGRHARGDQGGLPHRALRRVHQPVSRRATTRSSASAASSCRAGSVSACRSPARSWPTRGS